MNIDKLKEVIKREKLRCELSVDTHGRFTLKELRAIEKFIKEYEDTLEYEEWKLYNQIED